MVRKKGVRTSIKYLAIYRQRSTYPVARMCAFFEVSRSGYYDFVKRMDEPDGDDVLAEDIKECQFQSRKTYGYRRVHIWLIKNG